MRHRFTLAALCAWHLVRLATMRCAHVQEVVHRIFGYLALDVALFAIFWGFRFIRLSGTIETNRWRNAYIIFIAILGGILVLVKIAGFIVGRKAKRSSGAARSAAPPNGKNGMTNKTQTVK